MGTSAGSRPRRSPFTGAWAAVGQRLSHACVQAAAASGRAQLTPVHLCVPGLMECPSICTTRPPPQALDCSPTRPALPASYWDDRREPPWALTVHWCVGSGWAAAVPRMRAGCCRIRASPAHARASVRACLPGLHTRLRASTLLRCSTLAHTLGYLRSSTSTYTPPSSTCCSTLAHMPGSLSPLRACTLCARSPAHTPIHTCSNWRRGAD